MELNGAVWVCGLQKGESLRKNFVSGVHPGLVAPKMYNEVQNEILKLINDYRHKHTVPVARKLASRDCGYLVRFSPLRNLVEFRYLLVPRTPLSALIFEAGQLLACIGNCSLPQTLPCRHVSERSSHARPADGARLEQKLQSACGRHYQRARSSRPKPGQT